MYEPVDSVKIRSILRFYFYNSFFLGSKHMIYKVVYYLQTKIITFTELLMNSFKIYG